MANLSNITNAYAAPQIVATGTLAAGQTDIGLSVSFPVNQYPSAQIGSVLVYVNGQLLLRNTGNATASLTADGNYQEVDSGTGVSSLIRLNVADPLNARPYAILSNGFNIAQPASTVQSQIQTLQTQQDNMATTLAEVAGIAVSSLYTPLNDATRATFASQFATLQSDAALKNVSNTFTQPQLIPGRTDGASIGVGFVGEIQTNIGGSAALTTGQYGDRGQLTLTPGVYMLTGTVRFTPAASTSISRLLAGIGTVAGNSGAGVNVPSTASDAFYPASYVPADQITVNIPIIFVNISTTTTYYLKALSNFAVSTNSADGILRAVRIA